MYVNMLSLSPSKIVEYWQYVNEGNHASIKIKSLENLKHNKQNGVLSKNAKKRMLNAIDWLCAYATNKLIYDKKTGKRFKYQVGFITLTLSSTQTHSDNTIKKELLNQFFVEAKNRWKVVHYVWRAETQKNGNLHFHILLDKFVPYQELRNVWNRIQNKLGYVDRFAEKNKHHDPNSTDVHSVINIKNIRKYVSSYMSKESDVREVTGNLWGLSYSLSKSKPLTVQNWDSTEVSWLQLQTYFSDKVKLLEHCKAVYEDILKTGQSVFNPLLTKFADYVACQRDFWNTSQLSLVPQ